MDRRHTCDENCAHTVALPTPIEAAVIQAWRGSDYDGLIPLEHLGPVAALAVAAARPLIGEQIAVAIEQARETAKAYHYRAALTKAAGIAREGTTRE